MKIAVHIAFYYRIERFQYLNEIIKEYNSYSIDVDLFIHTNKNINSDILTPYNNGKIQILKHSLYNFFIYKGTSYYLTWKPRKLIASQVNDYDIFLYSEDDILIPENAFNYWIENKDICQENKYNVGFLRIEVKDDEEYLSDLTSKLKNKISIRDQEFFLNEKNPYCAFWIYDNDEMRKWTKSDFYDLRVVHGYKEKHSNLLKILKLDKFLSFNYLIYNLKHKRIDSCMEASAYGLNYPNIDWFKNTALKVENGQIDPNCRVYHLPNNYVNETKTDMGTLKFSEIL